MPFSLFEQLPEELAARVPNQARQGRARLGRGGRLIFDRCRPFTLESVDAEGEEAVKPFHEMSNPYSAWSGTGTERVKLKIVTPSAPAREATPAQDGGTRG